MSHQVPSHMSRASRCIRTPPAPRLHLFTPSRIIRPRPVTRIPHNHAYTTQHSPSATASKASPSRIVTYLSLSTLLATLYYSATNPPHLADAPSTLPPTALTPPTPETDLVPTGTSTVPFFPRTIFLPRAAGTTTTKSAALPAGLGAADDDEEYHLLGLGIRTVSFLRIQVYVVGLYVATSSLSALQESMIHAVTPATSTASTLVAGEKAELRSALLDPEASERIWAGVLREGAVKTALRIVPTRNTDFGHLRDGWVRGIDARGKGLEFQDEGFKTAVSEFKGVFGGRKGVGKGKVLLLGRGERGGLGVWVEDEEVVVAGPGLAEGTGKAEGAKEVAKMTKLGEVTDERISRLVWLGYLAGKTAASEGARKSVVDGVVEIVERPIGTVETQVV